MRHSLTTLLAIVLSVGCGKSWSEEAGGLLKPALLANQEMLSITYFRCPSGTQCLVNCAAGEGQVTANYANVRRMELAEGLERAVMGIHYVDAVGKPHVAIAILPRTLGCTFTDFLVQRIYPIIDGVIESDEEEEIIFEVEPGR